MAEDKEIVVYAFADLPVRIVWLKRGGSIMREEVLTETSDLRARLTALAGRLRNLSPDPALDAYDTGRQNGRLEAADAIDAILRETAAAAGDGTTTTAEGESER